MLEVAQLRNLVCAQHKFDQVEVRHSSNDHLAVQAPCLDSFSETLPEDEVVDHHVAAYGAAPWRVGEGEVVDACGSHVLDQLVSIFTRFSCRDEDLCSAAIRVHLKLVTVQSG